MVAQVRIKSLVDRYPLSGVKQAYDDFAHGHLVGRAVVIPGAAAGRSAYRKVFVCRKRTRMSAPQSGRGTELVLDTLKIRREGAVLFAEISAPPMNLQGPELIRDFVSLIQRAEADDTLKVIVFKSADPDYFISHVDRA